MKRKTELRLTYVGIFLAILAIEILIALFVRDRFIRPYGGDMLVTVLICCFVRIFIVSGCRLLPLWVFFFSAAVEVAQLFDPAMLLGLGNIAFFRIVLGSTFSFADLLCYAAGCLIFFLAESALNRHPSQDS